MRDKKEFSALLPYRRANGGFEYFMQKRSLTAPRSPGRVGIFGGHIEEGENIEQALFREMNEELSYKPQAPKYFSRYETAGGIVHVFLEEVTNGFESTVKIGEGEYGKFYSASEVADLKTSHVAGIAVQEIDEWLRR